MLDFGLTKIGAADLKAVDMSQSPTTVDATRVGAVLGTAAPE